MTIFLYVAIGGAAIFALAMRRAPLWGWAVGAGLAAFVWRSGMLYGYTHVPTLSPLTILAFLPALAFAVFAIPALRRRWIVAPTFAAIKQVLPKVSDTEAQALEAGTIGFDAELFSGRPDWSKLRAVPRHHADVGGEGLSRRSDRGPLPHDQRLAGAPRRQGNPRADLGLRQGARLPRHADLEGARRPRLLGPGAIADPRQDRLALAGRRAPSSWCRTRSVRAN